MNQRLGNVEQTLRDHIEHLLARDADKGPPQWPGDVFGVCMSALLVSGSYCQALSSWPPQADIEGVGRWSELVKGMGNKWRTIEWTADGWFRVPAGVTAESAIPMPIPGTRQLPLPDPSDGFASADLGLQWAFWHEFAPARFSTGQGVLRSEEHTSELQSL